jgi:hypothetical protein
MRWLVLIACLLGCEGGKGGGVACEFNGMTFQPGDEFPAGDGCNSCFCSDEGDVSCTRSVCPDAGVIDGPAACNPSGGCSTGVACGAVCCAAGERCDEGVCRCGSAPGCTGDDVCAAAGPVGQDGCGSVCCGESSPCPQ